MSQGTSWLLQISVGPVQEFIAAALRTRDLWFGSFMLSEISKAAAKAVQDAEAELIFPEPNGDLSPESDLSVANVVLAQASGDVEAMNALAERAREAAVARFEAFATKVYEKAKHWIVKERWDKQVKDVIEFYAAWAEIGTGEGAYKAARQKVARLLAARKNLRDFLPHEGEFGVPKSSLDGLRESVFKDGKVPKIAGLRLKEGEALDSVGLIKRISGDGRFPSVSRVAVDPWVRGVKEETLRELTPYCEALVEMGAISRVMGYEAFPYEGTAVLLSRHASMLAECELKYGSEEREAVKVRAACRGIAAILSGLKEHDRPQEPYFALLVADGDRMGAAISEIGDMKGHQEFSSTLSKFAGEARKIVKKFHGVCVYTGGDDVLAFLPLDTCLGCARKLHDAFGELLKDYVSSKDQKSPTLSVGISIGHAMEDLEDLREFGRKADKNAKEGAGKGNLKEKTERNGLAVVVRSRGSGAVVVREQWGNRAEEKRDETQPLAEVSLDERLHYWARLFANGAIPNKFPYELRENAAFYRGWEVGNILGDAMRDDVKRVFHRKDVTLSDKERNRVKKYIDAALCGSCQIDRLQNELVISRGDARDIDRLSDELLIAQWIGFGVRQVKGGDR